MINSIYIFIKTDLLFFNLNKISNMKINNKKIIFFFNDDSTIFIIIILTEQYINHRM